jgi:hypothetical protein
MLSAGFRATNESLWLWVPAFAGTTKIYFDCQTAGERLRSRGTNMPEWRMNFTAPKSEGAGNAGRVSAPAASRAKNKKHGE